MWLWIGRNQKWIGFIGIVWIALTALSFIFSVIPVYNATPSLDTFYATQVPAIICDNSIDNTIITIDDISIRMSDVCARWTFPILANQQLTINDPQQMLISLGMGSSIIITWPAKGSINRTTNNDGIISYTFIKKNGTWLYYNPSGGEQIFDGRQISIANTFQHDKKVYLQKNYKRTREEAPSITKIALRKMRLLSLIDRSYNDKIHNLEFYLNKIK